MSEILSMVRESLRNHRRKCCDCSEFKPINEFVKHQHKALGYNYICLECQRKRNKKYYQENAQEQRDRARKYYWDNRDIRLAKQRAWYAKNKERERIRIREYRDEHPEVYAAHIAITTAVGANKMEPASSLRCSRCDSMASDYHHHKGYDEQHRLDVVPLCKNCHGKIHRA